MDYEQIEQYIYRNDVSIYDTLNALHPFYRYKLYQKIKENSRLNDDCNPELLASIIVRMLPKLRKEITESFELVSFSYLKLLEIQRITKTRLTRKANRCRTNLRKSLGILLDEDEFQTKFNEDRKNHYRRLKFNGINVLDSIEKKKNQAYARDWAISQCLDQSARLLWLTQSQADSGYFISLTLPPRFHKTTFESANNEINKRLNNIKKDADRAKLTWLGIYKIHGHKDETPHLHIIYYVNDRDKDRLNQIFFKYFQNEEERWEQNNSINQSIWNFDGCLRYVFKDHGEPNVRIGFIGLRRDIKKVWHSLYTGDFGNKSLSYLSDDRLWMFRKLMRKTSTDDYVEHIPGYTLFCIKCFRDSRINRLADKSTDISQTDFADAYVYLIGMWEYLNPEKSVFKVEKAQENGKKRSYALGFGYIYLYNNQECILQEFYFWECEKSRGQPPPSWRRKRLNQTNAGQIISGISEDWHKNHHTCGKGAESPEITI